MVRVLGLLMSRSLQYITLSNYFMCTVQAYLQGTYTDQSHHEEPFVTCKILTRHCITTFFGLFLTFMVFQRKPLTLANQWPWMGSNFFCLSSWQVHVSDNVYSTDGFMTTIVSPLTDQRKKIFSMDCEMASSHNNIHICVMWIVLNLNWKWKFCLFRFISQSKRNRLIRSNLQSVLSTRESQTDNYSWKREPYW